MGETRRPRIVEFARQGRALGEAQHACARYADRVGAGNTEQQRAYLVDVHALDFLPVAEIADGADVIDTGEALPVQPGRIAQKARILDRHVGLGDADRVAAAVVGVVAQPFGGQDIGNHAADDPPCRCVGPVHRRTVGHSTSPIFVPGD
jgi:hypothetical protein